ncbi:hypothetical protein AAFN60_01795 [Roseibacillus persicicus]|uniref:hypothetical protein n=1 Tax=Roseibacillus persicicus TaxID=454148 RepID=UPI00398BA606
MNSTNTNTTESDYHSEAIEQDIATTRNRMDETWQKLTEKAEPNELFGSLYDWMKDKLEHLDHTATADHLKEAGNRAGRIIRDNPVPVALGVAALGSTLLPSSSDRHDASSPVNDDHSNRFANLRETSQERLEQGREKLSGTAEQAKTVASEKAAQVRESADKALGKVQEATHQTGEHVNEIAQKTAEKVGATTRTNPLAICAGALVSGFALGLLFPKSEQEEKLYGRAANKVKTKATTACRKALEKTREQIREKQLDAQGLEHRAETAINNGADQLEESIAAS